MEQKNSSKGLILVLILFVGGIAVLGCGGILAAIAIPAFTRYIKKSKATEAVANTRMLSSMIEMGYVETCKFPEPLPPTFDPADPACCGGNKCTPDGPSPEYWSLNHGSVLNQPNYFSYSAAPGPDNTFVINANADFACGGPQHTVTVTLRATGDGDSCSIESSPPITNDEFE